MPKSTIEIFSKYTDLSSIPIQQSFQKTQKSAVDLAKEFDSLKRSIRASMAYTRDAIVKTMKESSVASEKHTKAMKHHLRFLGLEIGKFAGEIGSLRNKILVYYFAMRLILDPLKKVTQAMMEQEDAIKRINFSMGIQGTQSELMSDKLIKLSQNFQKTTRYGDDLVLRVMEELVRTGNIIPSRLEKVTQAVLDVASATGRAPIEIAEGFAKAAQGYTRGLRSMGIAIDEATPKGEILSAVLESVNKRMGGRAQKDTDSYSGKVSQLSNSFNELKESIGFFLVESFKLDKVVPFFKNIFDFLAGGSPKENELDRINEQILNLDKVILKIESHKPLKIFGKEIIPAPIATAEREMKEALLSKKQFLEQENFKKTVLTEVQARAEQQAQERLSSQEKFNTQYNALSSRRLEFEREILEKDYEEFRENVNDKKAVAQLYQEKLQDLRILEKAERRKHPVMESIAESKRSLDEFFSTNGPAYVNFMTSYAKGAEDALTKGFINVIKGNFEGLKDVVADFGNMLLETMMRLAAQAIMLRIGFASFVGLHTGGYIQHGRETSSGYRKKFHSGGEVSATLLEGEGVLNRRAMSNLGVNNLDKLNRGEAAGGTTINNYYIQTIDERSFRERLQQHGDIFSGAAKRGIEDNTALRKTSQRFG